MKKFGKIFGSCMIVMILAAGLVFSGGQREAAEDELLIGGAIMNLAWPWFLGTVEGMENIGEEVGDIDFVFEDGQFDISTQIQQLENMAQLGVDGIVVFPVDGQAIIPTMVELHEMYGITFVVGDYPQSPESEEDIVWETFVGHDFRAMGEVSGQVAVDYLKSEGITDPVCAFVTIPPSGQASIDRYEGFASVVKDAFPNAVIEEVPDAQGNMDSAQTVFENTLTRRSDFHVVSGHNDAVVLGAYNAAVSQNLLGDMKFIGMAGMRDVLQYIEEGNPAWIGQVLQDPIVLGETAMLALLEALEGEELPDEYPLPTPEAITPENIDEYDWKSWRWLGN